MKKLLIISILALTLVAGGIYAQLNTTTNGKGPVEVFQKDDDRKVVDFGKDKWGDHVYRAYYKEGYVDYMITSNGDVNAFLKLYDYKGVENIYSEVYICTNKDKDVVHREIVLDISGDEVKGAIEGEKGKEQIVFGVMDSEKNSKYAKEGISLSVLVWYTKNGIQKYMDVGVKYF
jgi:uncharacterized protein YxeA